MNSLVAFIMIWIGFTTGLDSDISIPEIKIVNQSKLNSIAPYGNGRNILKNGYAAKYEYIQFDIRFPGYGTIYILPTFDKDNVLHQAVLAHELFHHYQLIYGIKYDCQNQREFEAYTIQHQFLKDHKDKVKKVKNINKFPKFDNEFLNNLKKC